LFDRGPDAIVEKAKEDKEKQGEGGFAETFTYEELKALMELCFSEGVSNRDRGIASAAKRRLDDKLLGLSEHMWQS
jgi:exocyst complex component 4